MLANSETNTKSEVALTEKQKKAKEELERVFNQMSSDLEKQEPTKDEIDEFERKQEENAIISYKQLMEEAKKLKEKADEYEQEADKVADMKIDDAINTYEKHSKINVSEIETSKPQEAYQGFKNSDIISPIYGIQKEKKDKKIKNQVTLQTVNAKSQMQNKSKESVSSNSDSLILQKNFEYLLKQVQDVQKNQATSKVSLNQMEEYLYRMNMVMTNTKLRGNWGEYQLDMLLSVYCGQNPSIYSMQYTLPNGKIADCAFHLPDTNKVLCIDSKFPMENYMNLQEDMDTYLRPFKMNMKKHIDDVANKYINMDTMPYALLFVPSEAIYQFVCAKCDDLFTYALQKHVMLVSPTTLVAEVMTLLSSTKDFYRTSHMEEIERNILLLQEDANRLVERSVKAEKTLETLATQFHAVSISAQKLSSRMTKMGEDE